MVIVPEGLSGYILPYTDWYECPSWWQVGLFLAGRLYKFSLWRNSTLAKFSSDKYDKVSSSLFLKFKNSSDCFWVLLFKCDLNSLKPFLPIFIAFDNSFNSSSLFIIRLVFEKFGFWINFVLRFFVRFEYVAKLKSYGSKLIFLIPDFLITFLASFIRSFVIITDDTIASVLASISYLASVIKKDSSPMLIKSWLSQEYPHS